MKKVITTIALLTLSTVSMAEEQLQLKLSMDFQIDSLESAPPVTSAPSITCDYSEFPFRNMILLGGTDTFGSFTSPMPVELYWGAERGGSSTFWPAEPFPTHQTAVFIQNNVVIGLMPLWDIAGEYTIPNLEYGGNTYVYDDDLIYGGVHGQNYTGEVTGMGYVFSGWAVPLCIED